MTGCRIGKVRPKLKVVEDFPYPVNEEAVGYLKHLSEMVESGEMRSIAIAAVNSRGFAHTAFSMDFSENPVLLLGSVEWLRTRLSRKVEDSV